MLPLQTAPGATPAVTSASQHTQCVSPGSFLALAAMLGYVFHRTTRLGLPVTQSVSDSAFLKIFQLTIAGFVAMLLCAWACSVSVCTLCVEVSVWGVGVQDEGLPPASLLAAA